MRTFRIKIIVFFLFFPISLFSQIADTEKVKEDNALFFKEYCPKGEFSFCYDGYGQFFRFFEFLVKYNSEPLLDCYKNGIYLMPTVETDEWLKKQNLPHTSSEILNKSFDQVVKASNVESHHYPLLKSRINKYYEDNKLPISFNGDLYVKKIMLYLRYVHVGEKEILLPNIKASNNDEIVEKIKVDVFVITDLVF